MKRNATECSRQTQAAIRRRPAASNGDVMTAARGRRIDQILFPYGVARTVGRESRRSIQALTWGKSLPIFAW